MAYKEKLNAEIENMIHNKRRRYFLYFSFVHMNIQRYDSKIVKELETVTYKTTVTNNRVMH